jgi:acyl-CoA thioesterase-1
MNRCGRHLLFSFLALGVYCSSLVGGDELSPQEQRQVDEAEATWKGTPEGRAATSKFNQVLRAYRLDRAKFPADRDRQVSVDYRQALKEFEASQRKGILAQNPALAGLLEIADAAAKVPPPALQPVEDRPGLPRVLLIGDSISIGYTLEVRRLLKDKANIHRIPQNGGATDVGLERIDTWLGDGNWDVIHFNFGLHDAKFQSETTLRSTREEYAANLRTLVTQMKGTGAKLIFATTTPVPLGGNLSPTRKFDSIPERNTAAVQVMAECGVTVNDLYATVLPVFTQVGRPNDVHFQPEGYDVLARAVARSIEAVLSAK